MTNDDKRKVFSEIDAFLDIVGEEKKNKVPKKLREMYKLKKKLDYNPKYTTEKPINEQGIKKETLSMIALLHLNYWCESEEEKKELTKILKENEEKFQQKYSADNLFN